MRPTLFILISFLATAVSLSAQPIKITGKIIDAVESTPIEFGIITLQTQDSTIVKGVNSNDDGKFIITGANINQKYLLSISYLGYQTQTLALSPAQQDIALGDIALQPSSILLNDVTVTAAPIIHKIDRDVILPNAMQVKSATSGISLLQNLMLPRIIIDHVNNAIKTSNGSEVQLRINGVVASYPEVLALIPEDVIRVEYHDNPGLRYGDVEAVLDFVTRRKNSGGGLNAELMNNPFSGFGNNSFNAKVNHKKSEFSYNFGQYYRDFDLTNNSEQTFIYPNGQTILQERVGSSTPFKTMGISNSLNYSLQESGKYYFNAALRYYFRETPNFWTDDNSTYKSGTSNVPIDTYKRSSYLSNSPTLDLYYERNLKNKQVIIFNIVGQYSFDKWIYQYQEKRNEQVYTDIVSWDRNQRYDFRAEGIYEKSLESSKFSAGIKHSQSYTKNTFESNSKTLSNINQAYSYLYAEYQMKTGKLNSSLGVGATRNYYSIGDEKTEKYTFRPVVRLTYNINDDLFFKYNGTIYSRTPNNSDLKDIEQAIDSLQVQRGNPYLKPSLTYQNTLSGGYKIGILNLNLWSRYNYTNKNISSEIFFDNGKFVTQSNNQKSFHHITAQLQFQVQVIKDRLSVSLTPGVNRYINQGNNYTHTYTNWYYRTEINGNYKKWIFNAYLNNKNKYFEGEYLYTGEPWQDINFGYKTDRFSISAGAINLFLFSKWNTGEENWSAIAPSSVNTTANNITAMPYLKFSYNINFGRQYKSISKKISDSEN